MRASLESILVATLAGTGIGCLVWQFRLGTYVWPAHPNVFGLVVTLVATVLAQRIWSPAYFRSVGKIM
jgi:hypothetical protein